MTMPAEPAAPEAPTQPVVLPTGDGSVLVGADAPVVAPTAPEHHQPTRTFSEDEISKARQQEKDKLYPQIERLTESQRALESELDRLRQEREEKQRLDQERQTEAERLAREAEEQDMDTRDLLERRTQELQLRIDTQAEELRQRDALLERERSYVELQTYRAQRIAQEAETIIPELQDLVVGETAEEIETSIAGLRDRSARILDGVAQATRSARQQMQGVPVTAPPVGPLDTDTGQASFSAEDISAMSMSEYARIRDKLLNSASRGRERGLFG